jgi:hypothetical protein
MMRRRIFLAAVVSALVIGVAAPAGAVIDEIYAAYCSGRPITPPGVDFGGPAEGQPVNASGIVGFHGPDNHLGTTGDGFHLTFDDSRRNAKIVSLGFTINAGSDLEPFYIDPFIVDETFKGFANCPNFSVPGP